MFLLSLIWLAIGLCLGIIVNGAAIQSIIGTRWHWLAILCLAGCAGWLGGWLGLWLFGRLFALVTACWVAIVSAIGIPSGCLLLQRRKLTKISSL